MAPELTKLLNDSDPSVVARAQLMTNQLSKKEACRLALANSPQVIAALNGSIQIANDAQCQYNVASALCNMSRHKVGLAVIFNCGVIPLLIKLLGSSEEKVVFLAMTCLHNLIVHQEGSKSVVRQAGGVVKMSHLLKVNNAKFLALTTDCLQVLAYGNNESKEEIVASGGAKELVRIMSSAVYEKLLWTCSRLLKVLSVDAKAKQVIVQNTGMQILGGLLNQQQTSKRLVSNCLWTLRNLSDISNKQENVENLIQRLVKMLSSNDLNWVTCASGVLSNLTCNNSRNKTICVQVGGVEGFLRVIKQCIENNIADMAEPAICALRHVTARHAESDNAQNGVRRHSGIGIICDMLQPPLTNWPVIKAVVGLVRNLSLCPGNQEPLRQCNVVAHLASLLQYAHGVAQQEAATGVLENAEMYDGVTMDEIVEWSAAALHILARDPNIRAAIRSLNMVPIFVQILYSQHTSITRVVCGLLNELSQDIEGARLIESEGATAPLQELIQNNDPHIASYSAAVLYNMSSDKPDDYIKRLSVDLANQFTQGRDDFLADQHRNYALNEQLDVDINDMNHGADPGLFGSDL